MRSMWFVGMMGVLWTGCACGGAASPGTEPREPASSVPVQQMTTHSGISFAIDTSLGKDLCRLSPDLFPSYTATRQVRVQFNGLLALCTLDTSAHSSTTASRMYMNAETLQRKLGLAGTSSATGVINESYLTGSDSNGTTGVARPQTGSAPTLLASAASDVQEWSRSSNQGTVAWLAPHGQIETGTVEQVSSVVIAANQPRDDVWVAVLRDGPSGSGDRLHTTSTQINPDSFAMLRPLASKGYTYAASFHGFTASEHPDANGDVLVGGAADVSFRTGVRLSILDELALVNVSDVTVTHIPGDSGLEGDEPTNIINRIATPYSIQVEQALVVRSNTDKRNAVVRGVKSVFDCLLDSADNSVAYTSPTPMSVTGTPANYTAGQCRRWIVEPDINLPNPAQSVLLSPSAPCTAGARLGVNFFKWENGLWVRQGGESVVGQQGASGCTWSSPPTQLSQRTGRYRIIVHSVNAAGNAVAPTLTITP